MTFSSSNWRIFFSSWLFYNFTPARDFSNWINICEKVAAIEDADEVERQTKKDRKNKVKRVPF